MHSSFRNGLQALERLLSQSAFENYYENNSKEFIQYWIKLIHLFEDIFTKKIKIFNNNPTLYLHFIKFYCSLLQFNNIHLRNLILKFLTNFFLHNYPWVRRQAAQHLYDTCIMFNDDLFSDNNEQNLDELTNIRQTLLRLFNIE